MVRNIDYSFKSYIDFFIGTIQMYTIPKEFNQSIPNRIIVALFSNPVHLTNLHQRWFINQTNSLLPNLAVAAQIYFATLQNNFSYVN